MTPNERLKKLAEFDYDENHQASIASRKVGTGPLNGVFKDGYFCGARANHEKIQPLIDFLIKEREELREALEWQREALEWQVARGRSYLHLNTDDAQRVLNNSDARLEALLKEME